MNEKRLLELIQRILEKSESNQVHIVLKQLQEILESDGISGELILLVKEASEGYPESKTDLAPGKELTKEQLEISLRRARERKHREELAQMHSRC